MVSFAIGSSVSIAVRFWPARSGRRFSDVAPGVAVIERGTALVQLGREDASLRRAEVDLQAAVDRLRPLEAACRNPAAERPRLRERDSFPDRARRAWPARELADVREVRIAV